MGKGKQGKPAKRRTEVSLSGGGVKAAWGEGLFDLLRVVAG